MSAARTTTLWTAAEAAAATGGHIAGAWAATGVSIDSRSVTSGDLFVAIEGPSFDGHDFVPRALTAGAVAAVVHRRPDGLEDDPRLLMVGDTLDALVALGRAARDRTGARVIAVTGSVGKTGVKEALRLVLAEQAVTGANLGSLNNHWGLPLSLARLPRDAVYAVLEMGMNHPGEITPLSRLARPHVALITAIEAVHSGFFSSLEEIADAKAEVFTGLVSRGAAVLNRDNPHFQRLTEAANAQGATTVVGFGAHADAAVRLLECSPDAGGSDVVARIGGRDLGYRIGVPGRHWVINSLGVLATVAVAGGDVERAAAALAGMKAPPGRGRRHRLQLPEGGFEMIDESYNASPVSMRAAIEVLGAAPIGPEGRRIAVLGDMLELGEAAPDLHAALAEPLRENAIDLVFTAGEHMGRLSRILPASMQGDHAADSEKLVPLVQTSLRPGDVVMVKGSLGSRTGLVVRALLAAGGEGA